MNTEITSLKLLKFDCINSWESVNKYWHKIGVDRIKLGAKSMEINLKFLQRTMQFF